MFSSCNEVHYQCTLRSSLRDGQVNEAHLFVTKGPAGAINVICPTRLGHETGCATLSTTASCNNDVMGNTAGSAPRSVQVDRAFQTCIQNTYTATKAIRQVNTAKTGFKDSFTQTPATFEASITPMSPTKHTLRKRCSNNLIITGQGYKNLHVLHAIMVDRQLRARTRATKGVSTA